MEPSLKVTVPVGIPLPGAFAVTFAVKVTLFPKLDGFKEDEREVVVGSLTTTCVIAVEFDPVKFVSP